MPAVSVAVHHAGSIACSLAAHGIRCGGNDPEALVVGVASETELESLSVLASAHPGVPVLVLVPRDSSNANALRALAAVELGARAVLPVDRGAEHLARAIVQVLGRDVVTDAFVGELFIRAIHARLQPRTEAPGVEGCEPRCNLTAREIEVVDRLRNGFTYEEVGNSLGVSTNTVRSHIRSVYEKLQVSTKTEAVLEALRLGWVT